MNEQIKVQQLLQRKFLEMKSKNPSFSIRALASKLEMQPAATNEILKGQRRVSREIAEKIADRLQLDPSERTELLRDFPLVLKRNTKKSKARDMDLGSLRLNSDQFELISDWLHFAILSFMRMKCFKSDISWIAERLSVSEVEVRRAILRLQSLNLVHMSEKGELTRLPQPIRSSDDVRDLSLQRMHMNDMDMAKKKIQEVKVDQRDFTNYTFPANPKTMSRAKEILRQAQEDIAALMGDEEASEVYRVCMYLFPLTNLESHK